MKRLMVSVMVLALVLCAFAANAQIPPRTEITFPVDFEADMQWVVDRILDESPAGLGWLAAVLGDEVDILLGFAPAIADLNGPWDEVNDLPGPNGMLDRYELGVVQAMANNPGNYTSGLAVTGAQVREALIENYDQMYIQGLHLLVYQTLPVLWGVVRGLLEAEGVENPPTWAQVGPTMQELFPRLSRLLAGYATIGDEHSMAIVMMVAELAGFCGLVGDGCLVDPPPSTNPDDYTRLTVLAPDGDLDNDGFSNRAEYDFFVGELGGTVAEYVAAVTDPEIAPSGVLPNPRVTLSGGSGRYNLDTTLTLVATPTHLDNVASYQWTLNDAALPDGEGATYTILAGQEWDSGTYKVEVTWFFPDTPEPGEDYEVSRSATTNLLFGDFGLPTTSLLGLTLFAGACALAGALSLRRRK